MAYYFSTVKTEVQENVQNWRGGGLFKLLRTHLYGEKLHSYGVTSKLGRAPAPLASLLLMLL